MQRLPLLLMIVLISVAIPTAAQPDRCRDGAALFADGLYAEAAEAYACQLAAAPDDPELYRGLIPAYLMTGRYLDAVFQLTPLRALFPEDDGDAYLNDWAAALEDADAIADRVTYAYLLWALARDNEAFQVYDQIVLEADGIPEEFASIFALSSSAWIGELPAKGAINATLTLDTNNVQVLTFMADTLSYAAEPEDVAALTEAALERFPDDPRLLMQRAGALIQLDRAAEALPLLQRVIAEAPEQADVRVYVMLADAYAALGDIAGTQSAIDRAVELGETTESATYTLMTALENAGDIRAASALALEYINLARQTTIRRDIGAGDAGPYRIDMRQGLVVEMRFEAVGGVAYTLTASSVNPDEVDPFIVLLDAEGTPIAFNDDRDAAANDYDSLIDPIVLDAGRYTLVISHAGLGSRGPVDVTISAS